MNSPRSPLGKGLAALLGENVVAAAQVSQQSLPLDKIVPNAEQPRQVIDQENLQDLIASVQRKGVLQPILVRKKEDGFFEIIAGERRWRAARAAKLTQIPVVVLSCSNQEALEIGLVENLQRHDLNPLEEAEAIKRLQEQFQLTQEDISYRIGKSRSHIANILRLNTLTPEIKDLLRNNKISAGHARALLSADNPEALVQEVLANNLSVRATEEKAKHQKQKNHTAQGGLEFAKPMDADIALLTNQLAENLQMKVQLKVSGDSGVLSISFKNLEQLDLLLARLQNV